MIIIIIITVQEIILLIRGACYDDEPDERESSMAA